MFGTIIKLIEKMQNMKFTILSIINSTINIIFRYIQLTQNICVITFTLFFYIKLNAVIPNSIKSTHTYIHILVDIKLNGSPNLSLCNYDKS